MSSMEKTLVLHKRSKDVGGGVNVGVANGCGIAGVDEME